VQEIDLANDRLRGQPTVLAENISLGLTSHTGAYTAAASLLVYRQDGHISEANELHQFDRSGTRLGSIAVNKGLIGSMSLSQDERELLVAQFNSDHDTMSLWKRDMKTGVHQSLKHDATGYVSYTLPVSSPDGNSFLYLSNESETWTIHEYWPETGKHQNLGRGQVQQYLRGRRALARLTYTAAASDRELGVPNFAILNLDNHSAEWLPLPNGARQPRLSPNEKLIAFTLAGESGTEYEIHIQRRAGGKEMRVSRRGGLDPHWSANGRELFYLSPDGWMMVVRIDPVLGTPGNPVPLFQISIRRGEVLQPAVMDRNRYVVFGDGQRFLVSYPTGSFQPVRVIHNWRTPPK
jgi:hypothetical protein